MKRIALTIILAASFAINAFSSHAQGLTWSNDIAVSNITDVGGNTDNRPSIASVVFDNQIWVAYTSNSCVSQGCPIKIAHSIIGTSLTFSTPITVPQSGVTGNVAVGYGSPTMTVLDGILYLAYSDGSNTKWITSSSNGITWSSPYKISSEASTETTFSIASNYYYPGKIYAGFSSASTHMPIICIVLLNSSSQPSSESCQSYSDLNKMYFGPTLGFYESTLFMSYEQRDSDHCVSGYILGPELGDSTSWNASLGCKDQTSYTPSLAQFGTRFFLAFASNDSTRGFDLRWSNYSDQVPIMSNRKSLSQRMTGPPNLLAVSSSDYTMLFNFYVWKNQMRYMYGE